MNPFEQFFKKMKAKILRFQFRKYEYFLVPFLLCDTKLNLSGLGTK